MPRFFMRPAHEPDFDPEDIVAARNTPAPAIDAEERKKTSSADNIFADLAELPSTFALRYPSPQAAWAHGVRQNAPLSTADAGRLRQKMRLAYAAWTGRDLEGDLHDDRFRPTPSETT